MFFERTLGLPHSIRWFIVPFSTLFPTRCFGYDFFYGTKVFKEILRPTFMRQRLWGWQWSEWTNEKVGLRGITKCWDRRDTHTCTYTYIIHALCINSSYIGIQPVWINPYIFHGSEAVTWEFLRIISHPIHHLSKVKMIEHELLSQFDCPLSHSIHGTGTVHLPTWKP